VKLHRVEDPQINGALGAAIIAMDALELSKNKKETVRAVATN